MACVAMFGLAWVVGYGICRAVRYGRTGDSVPTTLRLGLGWAAGAAFAGMTTFWAIALLPGYRGLAVGLVWPLGLGSWAIRLKQAPESPANTTARTAGAERPGGLAPRASPPSSASGSPTGSTSGSVTAAGGWDAWSIWTHRARYFYLCPEEWTRGFDPVLTWSHPEYPSLLPSLIVYGWLPAGRCVAAVADPDRLADPGRPALAPRRVHAGCLPTYGLALGLRRCSTRRFHWSGPRRSPGNTPTGRSPSSFCQRPDVWHFSSGRAGRGWLFLSGLFWGAAAFTKDEGKAAALVLAAGCTFAPSLFALSREGTEDAHRHRPPGPGPDARHAVAGDPAPFRPHCRQG